MEHVKQEFIAFLSKNVPNASLSSMDDIVLSYTVEVLSEVHNDDSSFDVDQFCEMVSAYVPEFAEVDSAVVCEWLFQLANNIKKQEVSTLSLSDSNDDQTCNVDVYESPEFSDEIGEPHPSVEVIDEKSPHESVMRPRVVKTSLDESQSTDDCKTVSGSSTSGVSRQMDNIPIDEEQLSLLVEMFPESSKDYIVQTLRRYHGDMDMAIQALLECNSERFRDESVKYGGVEGSTNEGKEKSMALSNVGSDTHLKSFVLSRYEYVDTHDDKRVHRPLLPNQEPEKKIRYRENHVVSTKGERFSVVTKKDQEGEELKKTYVSIKPLRKYRFH